MMGPPPLELAATLQLVKDYEVIINSLWSLFAVVLAATMTILAAASWKPRPGVLAAAFGLFAAGNIFGLYGAFETKALLIDYARSLGPHPDPFLAVLRAMQPPSLLGMVVFHLILDAAVMTVIFVVSREREKAHANA